MNAAAVVHEDDLLARLVDADLMAQRESSGSSTIDVSFDSVRVTHRRELVLARGVQRAPARAACDVVLSKREVVGHGV